MKHIQLQVIVPEEYNYSNLYITGQNSIFQNGKSKIKIKKIDDNIHFMEFNVIEPTLKYNYILELGNGELFTEIVHERYINLQNDCCISDIFGDIEFSNVVMENTPLKPEPEPELEPEPEYNIYYNNMYFMDYLYEPTTTKTNSYHLVSGYNRKDTNTRVKAYVRGNAPKSLENKTIVSGYTKKNGTKVKAYLRKKNN